MRPVGLPRQFRARPTQESISVTPGPGAIFYIKIFRGPWAPKNKMGAPGPPEKKKKTGGPGALVIRGALGPPGERGALGFGRLGYLRAAAGLIK